MISALSVIISGKEKKRFILAALTVATALLIPLAFPKLLYYLTDGSVTELPVNSDLTESYPTWSSSGRWIVFGSRRLDGLYTRPFYAYMDEEGNFHKPFVLPQKDPDLYTESMKSYNRSEPVTSAVDPDPRKLEKVSHSEAIKSEFLTSKQVLHN